MAKSEDPNRPTCPVCNILTCKKGRHGGHQLYTCSKCGVSGTTDNLPVNALRKAQRASGDLEPLPYDDPAAEPEPEPADCEVCEERPEWRDGLCRRCSNQLSRARLAASRLSDDQKRAEAHAAAKLLLEHGYVRLHLRTLAGPLSHYLKQGRKARAHEYAG